MSDTIIEVLMDNDDLTVLAPPSQITLSYDIGPVGRRGSTWFSGPGMPSELTIPDYDQLVTNDLYVDTETGVVYQYIILPSNTSDWVEVYTFGTGVAAGGGAVSSVAGRTGDVTLTVADLTDAGSLATDAELTAGLATKANTAHTHTASEISDSTATGRSLLTAADAAAARTTIGAGTSNLTIGTTATTAAAGNRQATATAIGMVELATTAEATAGTDTTRAVTPVGLKAVADTKAPALGADDNYVTDAEKTKLSNLSGTNTGDQDLSGLMPKTQTLNAQTGSYTLVDTDASKIVTVTASTAANVTVPANVFSAGQTVEVLDAGTARITFVAGSGMTLNATPSLVSRAQYSGHMIKFLSATSAVVIGDLA